jgi:hypothetical protein
VLLIGIGLSTVFTGDDSGTTTAIITPTETVTPSTTIPDVVPSVTPTSPVATTPGISPSVTPVVSPEITPTITPEISPTVSPTTTPASTPSPTGPTIIASAGTLEIWVTDAPAYDISEVWVTISNIEVHRGEVESEEEDDSEGIDGTNWEMVIEENKTFELLQLRDISEFLGSTELEAGHYTQIRMDIEEVTVTVDGESHIADIPSGKLKLVRGFDIVAGETTALTIDIDAEKSVTVSGKGKVHFNPTVKISIAQK